MLLHAHDDFAHHLALGEARNGLAGPRERESLRDLRFDGATSIELQEFSSIPFVRLWVAARERAPEHADDLTRFKQREVERAKEAIIQDLTAERNDLLIKLEETRKTLREEREKFLAEIHKKEELLSLFSATFKNLLDK